MGRFYPLSKHRRKNRLSYRILAYILICSTIFTFISTAIQLYAEYQRDMDSVEEGLNQIRESYLKFLSLSLWDMNESQLNLQLEGALLLPDIQHLEVREIRATTEEVFSTAGTPKDEGVTQYQFPLIHEAGQEKTHIGNLYVTVNLEGVNQRLYDRVALILSTQTIKTFLWAFCVLTIFQYVIMRNLNQIASYLKQLDVTRLHIPLTLNRKISASAQKDELEDVVMAINDMNKNLMQSMAERQRVEEELRKSERYKEIQNQIANVFLTVPDEEMYGEVLAVVLQAMKSKFGIFGFIEKNGDLVIPSLAKENWNECQVPGKSIIFPQNIWGDSLWGRSIREKKAFSSNGPFHIPEGHIPIDHFLTVPIAYGNEGIGILSVANKENGYAKEDQRLLESIAGYISPILNARLQRDRKEQERKLTEDGLKASEERFRRLAENARDIIFRMSLPDGTYEYVSPAVTELSGYTPEEFRSSPQLIHKIISPDWSSNFEKHWSRLLQGDMLPMYEYPIIHRSGEVRWWNQRNILVRDAGGRIIAIEGIVTDITDRKLAEEEIRMLNQELEQRVRDRTTQLEATNKELEAFAYSVSHDLRAPLRAIDGFSQILLEKHKDRLDSQGKHYLQRIRTAAQSMGQLIDDILSLSRISQSEMNLQETDLSKVVREISEILRTDQPERRSEFIIAEGIRANVDMRLFRIVMENLMGNAWKFTSTKPFTRIEFGMLPQEDRTIYFIRDNGAGFDMRYAQKLFGAFQRLHSVSEFPGTGIGLATAQRIIHRHGGRMWAEGELEKGASFYFTLS